MNRRNFLGAGSLALLSSKSAASVGPSAPSVDTVAAFRQDCRILFQGDSITDGNRGRSDDPNHILGHGYVFIIAAKYGAALASRDLTFFNRGISGNKVTDLAKRWKIDTLDLQPGLLSVLIGVNDNSSSIPLTEFEQTYDELLGLARAANPDLLLVLCEPFTLRVGSKKGDWETWSAGIKKRQEIVVRLAGKYQAALARFQGALDAACALAPADHWIWDGVHPTYSGHQILADEWIRAVREFWPSP